MDLDRRVLHAAPWCWPPPKSRSRELLVERLGAVPTLRPGRAPGITVRGQTVTLWAIDARPGSEPPTPGFSRVPFGPDAQASWTTATVALPRSLPILWRSVLEAAREPPVATFLRSHLEQPGFEERDRVLDGPSFGLTFFLMLAALVLDEPLPPDVAAAAAIDERGRLLAVDGLDRKIGGLVAMAPTIRRVLVAADQRTSALEAQSGHVEVIGVASAAEALLRIYGERLAERIVEHGSDAGTRTELVDAFCRLALAGRGAAVGWSPVERGAALALEAWPLPTGERELLVFARAVAARHDRHAGDLPLPGGEAAEAWLDAQPAPRRLALLTHLVEQSADAGTPDARQIEALAARALPARLRDALLPHLTLMGALGRLRAITGRPREALDLQRAVARGFLDAYAEREVSVPLSEWLRLCGVLGDRTSFEEAQELRQRLVLGGGLDRQGLSSVTLAHARGALMLDLATPDVVDTLRALARDPGIPAHVRWSAARWLIVAIRRFAGADAAAAALALLQAQADAPDERDGAARRQAGLAALDAALLSGDQAGAAALVERLRTLDPGPLGHLLAESPDPARVARLHPD